MSASGASIAVAGTTSAAPNLLAYETCIPRAEALQNQLLVTPAFKVRTHCKFHGNWGIFSSSSILLTTAQTW